LSKKHTNPALPSNLVAPVGSGRPVLPNAVLRKELVQELIDYQADTALSRLVYFCAPAGWGKSVVMSQVFDRIAADGPGPSAGSTSATTWP
jgi:ATP/maltotriose-dependent transcriptional regulator MalT